jgi:hypothetical protein
MNFFKSFQNCITILIVFALTAAIPGHLFPQSSFEIIYSRDSAEQAVFSFETMGGKYIVLGATRNKDTLQNQYKGLILEIDEGSRYNSKIFSKPGRGLTFDLGFQMENGNYFIMGGLTDTLPEVTLGKHIYLCEMTSQFELVWEKHYPIPDGYLLTFGDFLVNQQHELILYCGLEILPYNKYYLYLTKFNLNGEMIIDRFLPQYNVDYDCEILQKPGGTGYYLIGSMSYDRGIVKNVFELDEDLNIIDSHGSLNGNGLGGPVGVKWLSDGRMFLANIESQETPGAYLDLEIRITDGEFNTLSDTVIFDSDNVQIPITRGVDFFTEDLIWTCTFNQVPPTFPGTEVFKVYLYDSQMNFKGVKSFGGDSRWWMYHLLATCDGGCILSGFKSEPESKALEDIDAYILKLMPEDIITGIADFDNNTSEIIEVYPNPVKDKLHIIGVNSGIKININAVDGRILLMKDLLANTENTINISSLSSGIYFYELIDNNQTVKSGKIIKQ